MCVVVRRNGISIYLSVYLDIIYYILQITYYKLRTAYCILRIKYLDIVYGCEYCVWMRKTRAALLACDGHDWRGEVR